MLWLLRLRLTLSATWIGMTLAAIPAEPGAATIALAIAAGLRILQGFQGFRLGGCNRFRLFRRCFCLLHGLYRRFGLYLGGFQLQHRFGYCPQYDRRRNRHRRLRGLYRRGCFAHSFRSRLGHSLLHRLICRFLLLANPLQPNRCTDGLHALDPGLSVVHRPEIRHVAVAHIPGNDVIASLRCTGTNEIAQPGGNLMIQRILSAHAHLKIVEIAGAFSDQNVHFHAQPIGVGAVEDNHLILRGQIGDATESLRGYVFKINEINIAHRCVSFGFRFAIIPAAPGAP